MSTKEEKNSPQLVHGLFLTHIDVIRGFIRALVRDHHLADDVLQETFLTVTQKATDFQRGTNFPKWACSIARFKVLEARRRKLKDPMFLSEEVIDQLAKEHQEGTNDFRLEHVKKCVSELPKSMRQMIDLYYVSQYKPAEIAREVGWTVESVYVTLSRARVAIRDCVQLKLIKREGQP